MIPEWLTDLSIANLCLGGACALTIIVDEANHPQKMWIMNVVWPVTALFGTAGILWQYFKYGRLATHERMNAGTDQLASSAKRPISFPAMVANGALHCGSGCVLGDICGEWLMFSFPAIAAAFGWHSLFSERIFSAWIVDYLFAYMFGILFQYFTIAPMRGLPPLKGIVAAIKADTLSLTAWQIGMYGFMALGYFVLFRSLLGVQLRTDSLAFWFMMQIAMLFGFMTSYPVNWWLLESGIKERM